MTDATHSFAVDFEHFRIGRSILVYADCLDWLRRIPKDSIHAVVTDPPYGIKEYDDYYEMALAAIPRLSKIDVPVVDCETDAHRDQPSLF